MKIRILVLLLYVSGISCAQSIKVPDVHSNIKKVGKDLVVNIDGKDVPHVESQNPLTLNNIRGKIAGTGKDGRLIKEDVQMVLYLLGIRNILIQSFMPDRQKY